MNSQVWIYLGIAVIIVLFRRRWMERKRIKKEDDKTDI